MFKINYKITICSLIAVLCLVTAFFIDQVSTLVTNTTTPPSSSAAAKPQEDETNTVALPVLMYHHILEKDTTDQYIITPTQFKNDMDELAKRGFTTVSPQQVLDFVENDIPLPEKPIMITFDDGYESVYKYAFPVLKEKDYKASALVLGYYTDLFSTDTPRHISYSNLSWDQLREMEQSGVFTIGNHSNNLHISKGKGSRYGTTKNPDETTEQYLKAVGDDLLSLNEKIKEQLGHDSLMFAYPFGAISKELKPLLDDNFKIIFTCDGRVNNIEKGSELPLILRRYNRDRKFSTSEFFKQFDKK